ncbi:hypothetical protein CKO51_08705 [Rhodopirellula sp. SM50]|nr:hypothetical protein CKO51_08705 [Rhodopirellula sp. SM50]
MNQAPAPMPTQSLARTHQETPGPVERPAPPQTVRFWIHLHAAHQRRGACRVLISLVHCKHPKPHDSQGSPRRVFGRIRL